MNRTAWSRGWIARSLPILIVTVPIILLLAATIHAVVTLEGETTQVRWSGRVRTRVPTWQAQLAVLPILGLFFSVACWQAGSAVLHFRRVVRSIQERAADRQRRTAAPRRSREMAGQAGTA